jgi:hypothetical protein
MRALTAAVLAHAHPSALAPVLAVASTPGGHLRLVAVLEGITACVEGDSADQGAW